MQQLKVQIFGIANKTANRPHCTAGLEGLGTGIERFQKKRRGSPRLSIDIQDNRYRLPVRLDVGARSHSHPPKMVLDWKRK